ncbi:thioredoxin family protein [Alcanivorax sp.]|jgi:thioredoxin 1|uniref:thioredoxin family protein n=1 Tax=Alcanivorax sp. TaxID=1872427 RepID=UPI0032D99A38
MKMRVLSEQLDQSEGLRVLEFGANWCGYCIAAQKDIETVLTDHPDLPHEKIADGPGRPLGRSFRVKLWPTLIRLRDGEEINRVVRPSNSEHVRKLFA